MANIFIRPIQESDSKFIALVIRRVMPEFGASGPGFAMVDPEVDHMFEAYSKSGHAYYVLTDGEKIFGGGGIGPLAGSDGRICELRKMYFLKEARGLGLGQKLMDACLEKARSLGYESCYLETLNLMVEARKLYEKNGFKNLKTPLGSTGHFGCDSWMLKSLS